MLVSLPANNDAPIPASSFCTHYDPAVSWQNRHSMGPHAQAKHEALNFCSSRSFASKASRLHICCGCGLQQIIMHTAPAEAACVLFRTDLLTHKAHAQQQQAKSNARRQPANGFPLECLAYAVRHLHLAQKGEQCPCRLLLLHRRQPQRRSM